MNNLPGNFFSPHEFSTATVTGFVFCCHWRQECWPFQAVDNIFHLILVCSDESKAVISPPAAERVGAQPCHPPPLHRARLMPGQHFMNGFLPGAHGAPHWLSCCFPTGSLWWVFGWKDQNGLWPPRALRCASPCAFVLCPASASTDDTGGVDCLKKGLFLIKLIQQLN